MDGIQVHKGEAVPSTASRSAPTSLAMNPAAAKTTSHYIRALRRRFWMVLAIAVPLAIASSILVLKLPPVFMAKAEIEINPPGIDPELSALMTHDPGHRDPTITANYVPNHEAWLRSKWLAQKVVDDDSIASEVAQYADPAFELFKTLTVQRLKGTNSFTVTLEGSDPARTRKLLDMLLIKLKREATNENEEKLRTTGEYANDTLKKLKESSSQLDRVIETALTNTNTIGPGGRNILEERFVNLGSIMTHKQLRLGELEQQLKMSELFPRYETDPEASARASRIAELTRKKRVFERALIEMRKTVRNFNGDSAVQRTAGMLDDVLDELDELRSFRKERLSTPHQIL